jgi:hypothetical protein
MSCPYRDPHLENARQAVTEDRDMREMNRLIDASGVLTGDDEGINFDDMLRLFDYMRSSSNLRWPSLPKNEY